MRFSLNIFSYTNYREYLRDFYQQKKKTHPSYSYRVFARQANVSSPSHLPMIIKGDRNLSLSSIGKFSAGLKLKKQEKVYFEKLVRYNQAQDLEEKAKIFSELMELRFKCTELFSLEKQNYRFLSRWYTVAIYSLVECQGFQNDGAWIAKRLKNKISPTQASQAIEDLLDLGFIHQDSSGKLSIGKGAISVPDEARTAAIHHYHSAMLELAQDSLKNDVVAEREMNGVTLAIPKSKLGDLKEKIRSFRKEINQMTSSYENPEEVYQLNIQLFQLTQGEDNQ